MAVVSIVAAVALLIWLDHPDAEKGYDDTTIANQGR